MRIRVKMGLSLFGALFTLLLCSGGGTSNDSRKKWEITGVLKTARDKRVVWGQSLLDVKSYEMMRFIVYITNGDCASNLSGWFKWYTGQCEPPYVGSLQCGGSLIAEHVVQTACHCVASYEERDIPDNLFTRPLDVWENQFVMYLGYYDVEEMEGGTRPRQFINHRRCKMHKSSAYNILGFTYDFGIILTQWPLIKKNRFTQPAPIYTVPELKRLYAQLQKQEKVCLIAGWGWYRLYKDLTAGYVSRYLQHSWNSALTYMDCSYACSWVKKYVHYLGKQRNITYQKFATWFCTGHFGKFRGSIGSGDSGSPVTCNNHYMGLVSTSLGPENMIKVHRPFIYAVHSAIKFTEEENAAEFRRGFLQKVLEIYVHATDLPPNTHDELSRGSRHHFHNQLGILMVTNVLLLVWCRTHLFRF